MDIKVNLNIGYPTATHEDIIEIPDEEIEGKSELEIEEICSEYAQEWANEYIEVWWEKSEKED